MHSFMFYVKTSSLRIFEKLLITATNIIIIVCLETHDIPKITRHPSAFWVPYDPAHTLASLLGEESGWW